MTIPNVLATRYAAPDLAQIWTPEHKVVLERRLWIAVLRAQRDLGVEVPDGVVEDYERVVDQVDLAAIAAAQPDGLPGSRGIARQLTQVGTIGAIVSEQLGEPIVREADARADVEQDEREWQASNEALQRGVLSHRFYIRSFQKPERLMPITAAKAWRAGSGRASTCIILRHRFHVH